MSLILTTNTSTNEPNVASNTGINRPFDYVNFTTDTFDIEPNSEVAVQSIKFNKEGNIQVNRTNNQFYINLGTKAGIANTNTTSLCCHTSLGNQDSRFEQYNNETLANIIKKAIDRGLKHPDMVPNNQTNTSGTEVSVSRDSDNKFDGYDIKINYGTSASLADKKSEGEWVDSIRKNDGNGSYLSASLTITKQPGKACEMIHTSAPMSQCNGSFTVDFSDAGDLWRVGLTRYLDEFQDDHADQNFGYFNPQGATFYDYLARAQFDVDAAKFYLRIYHAVIDPNDDLALALREIDYTHVTPLIEIQENSASYNASSITKLTWNIQNEKVMVFVSNASGNVKHTLFSGNNASKARNLKPTNTNTKYLYPKVSIQGDNKKFTIQELYSCKPTGFIYGDNLGAGGLSAGTLALGQADLDYFCNAYHSGTNGIGLAKRVDLREPFDYDLDAADTAYTQFGLNASGGFRVDGVGATSYGVSLVLTEDLSTGEGDIDFFPTIGANAAAVLGFQDMPYVIVPSASTTLSETFDSTNVPVQISTNSIFVRLNNFLQRTINGQTNGTSKIIYHVPRFDNSGNEFGGLFFEPGERTYVKLNNTSTLRRNEFSLSLVNSDETLAENITGKTIIMLHIRKSSQ